MLLSRIRQNILCCLSAALLLASCADEALFGGTSPVGEGESLVTATVEFKPFTPALDAGTRSQGDAIKAVRSLCVLLYDGDGNLVSKIPLTESAAATPGTYVLADSARQSETETVTPSATITLSVPYGRYYIYAVANMGDLSKYDERIATVTGLRTIQLTWRADDISANSQMFGHFCPPDDITAEAPLLAIDRPATVFRSWLRRAASKVTVAYDGSSLKDGVSIYIMSASIKDIPRKCLLGMANTPDHIDSLIHDGEIIKYFEGDVQPDEAGFFDNYKAVVNNKVPTQTYGSDHSETADALFFYENMQGIGEDKRQKDEDNDGNPDNADRLKDDKPCGTYIEVKAVYRSTNPERPGTGIATYRFMLGKNVTTNYDAERNHHYKLTLKFNNFANDYDWHIEYKEQVLEATEPKVMNYQGKVFMPDYSYPNRGHEFCDTNKVTVTSYMEEDERIKMDFSIKYRDSGKGEFTDASEWLEYVIEDGDVPYEKRVGFKVKEKYLQPDDEIDINARLKAAPSKGSKESPYNLANPNGSAGIVCTANCYMVDAPGWYILPLVYGNAIHEGGFNTNSYTYAGDSGNKILKRLKNHLGNEITSPYIKDNAGCTPVSATLVWQDEDTLLRPHYTWDWDTEGAMQESPRYIADAYNKKGGIRFYVSEEHIKQGNAVIAVKDGADRVMWSWHIWVTRLDVEARDKTIEVTSHDASRKYSFMPMNLGWCSEKGEKIKYYKERECEVMFISGSKTQTIKIVKKSHMAFTRGNNPYYQWGRKDPFIAARGNNQENGGAGNNKVRYDYKGYSDITNPPLLTDYFDDNKKTTREALHLLIQKPDTWHNPPRLDGTGGRDFDSDDKTYANLWNGRSSEDSLAQPVKTIYDPCPVGYQMPHKDAFTGFTTTGNDASWAPSWYDVQVGNIAGYNETRYLYEFYTNPDKYQSIIFPQTDYRDWNSYAGVFHFGEIGYIWTANNVNTNETSSYNFEFSRKDPWGASYIRPKNMFYTCDGFPVRPVYNGNHGKVTP